LPVLPLLSSLIFQDAVARVDGGDGSGGGAGGTVIINVTNVSGSAGIEAAAIFM